MLPVITNAEYLENYRIKISFDDGKNGIIDLENELWGEVFEPLKDLNEFKKFRIDPELRTIVWPSGADLAPEFLYEKIAA